MGKQETVLTNTKVHYSEIEIEVIILKASLDLINKMVNRAIMSFYFNSSDPLEIAEKAEIRFQSRKHRDYFSILLVDFLSSPENWFGGSGNYLERLIEISKSPLLRSNRVEALSKAAQSFQCWLGETIVVESRFNSLDLEIDLSIERQMFLTICGNMNKHNFTRRTRQAKKLQQVLHQNGQDISRDRCLIALEEDFLERFYDDIFLYHSSTMAEFLNNIRWGIYSYAHLEREKCVEEWDLYNGNLRIPRCKYNYPEGIVSELGRSYYRSLINDVVGPPDIQRFEATKSLKMDY